MKMILSYFLSFLLCVAGSYGLYDASSPVVDLNPSNFDKLVTNSDEVWLVEFYAPWCGHCKNLAPDYKKAAEALKGVVKVGAVDGDKHKSLSQRFGVTGFPTLKVFTGSKNVPYKGQRNAEAIVEGCLKAAKDTVFARLGRTGDSGSDGKHKPVSKVYGHKIPWKENGNTGTSRKPQNITTLKPLIKLLRQWKPLSMKKKNNSLIFRAKLSTSIPQKSTFRPQQTRALRNQRSTVKTQKSTIMKKQSNFTAKRVKAHPSTFKARQITKTKQSTLKVEQSTEELIFTSRPSTLRTKPSTFNFERSTPKPEKPIFGARLSTLRTQQPLVIITNVHRNLILNSRLPPIFGYRNKLESLQSHLFRRQFSYDDSRLDIVRIV